MQRAGEWPQLKAFLESDSLARLLEGATISSFSRRALGYLNSVVAELASVRGVSPARLSRLVKYGLADHETFLDHRAELEILRKLAARFAGDLEWEPETEQGIRPDVSLRHKGYPVYIEVARIRQTTTELELAEYVSQQESLLAAESSPFDVLLFLDLAGIDEGVDREDVISAAVQQTQEGILGIRDDQAKLRAIERAWQARQRDSDRRAAADHPDGNDLKKTVRRILEHGIDRDPVCQELQLNLPGGVSATASLFWRGTETPNCDIQCFGRLPDHSDRLWQKMVGEVRQLPRGEVGLVCLWIDCDADLFDFYSPEIRAVRRPSGEFRTLWRTSLQALFETNRDRLSAAIFHSGFKRELVLSPFAHAMLDSELAETLKLLLELEQWGYLKTDATDA